MDKIKETFGKHYVLEEKQRSKSFSSKRKAEPIFVEELLNKRIKSENNDKENRVMRG
ncbi:MAG: hypothetical protein RCG15_03210 [Candidatus Rickettsia vulgarisii]